MHTKTHVRSRRRDKAVALAAKLRPARNLRLACLCALLAVALCNSGIADAKSAACAKPTVLVEVRVREGETIERDNLKIPEYPSKTSDQPGFCTIDAVAGRVAIKDIAEGQLVQRDQVGERPAKQFDISGATPFRVEISLRRGAVLPNAPQALSHCTIDTATLPPQRAATLRDEILHSNVLLDAAGAYEIETGGYEDYRIGVSVRGITRTRVWTGAHAPAPARELAGKYLAACPAGG